VRNYTAAESLYKRALAMVEKTVGPEHPDVGGNLNHLAALYRDQGSYAAAEPLYKRSLTIAENAFGPEHPNVGAALVNLAGLYHDEENYAAADQFINARWRSTKKLSVRESGRRGETRGARGALSGSRKQCCGRTAL